MSLLNLVAKLTLDSSEYEASLGKAEKSAGGFGGAFGGAMTKLANLSIKALSAATAAVGAFAVASVKTGMEFDKSMSQVYATMGDKAQEMVEYNGKTVTSMEALRDFAQEMGATTQFSAKQSADALNYMALAGYDAQESMEMLPNVMNLAAAGAMDLARASDMVTDTQTAFGMDAKRTAQMVDEMAKAASTGNTSVEQLGDAFLTVGGLAQELNGGFVTLADGTKAPVDGIQEMEIALTAMANSGIKGSEAGTHMRNMLMKLSSPASEGTKQLQKLGVAVFDDEGQMRSLKDIMGDLSVKLDGLTQEQKIQAIADLFNTRDLASAEALLGAVGEDWDEIGDAILHADGAAEEMAKTQMDNLAGDITYFKSAVEGAQIAISDNLSPSLRKFVQEGTAGVSEFTKILKSGDMTGAINSIGQTIGNLATIVISKVPDMVKAGAVLLSGLIQGIQTAASSIDFGSLLGDAKQMFNAGLEMLTQLGAGIGESLPGFLENTALPMLTQFSEMLREGAGSLVDVGIEFILNIAQGLMDSLPTLLEQVPQIVINIAGIINDNAPKLIVGGIKLIMMIVQGIINAIPALIANFPKIVQAIFAVWSAVNWINLGKQVITFIGNGIKSLATTIPQFLRDIAQNGGSIIRNFGWASFGRAIIQLLVNGVRALASSIPSALRSIAGSAARAFISFSWSSTGRQIINGIASGIRNAAGKIVEAAKSAAKRAFEAAKNFLGIKSPSRLFRDEVGKMMAEGMAVGFDEGVDGEDYVEPINGLMDTIENIPTTTIETDTGETGNMSEAGMIYSLLQQYLPMFSQMSVVLYPDTVAGELAPFIDDSLGAIAIRRGRA